jgi:hypothetical protein
MAHLPAKPRALDWRNKLSSGISFAIVDRVVDERDTGAAARPPEAKGTHGSDGEPQNVPDPNRHQIGSAREPAGHAH